MLIKLGSRLRGNDKSDLFSTSIVNIESLKLNCKNARDISVCSVFSVAAFEFVG
jgi:hypothetical protein